MNHIIYMAAGNSTRFGAENKLLHEIDGKPMFLHGLSLLLQLVQARQDCTLTVVTRYTEIMEEMKQHTQSPRVRAVHSPESVNGISYTVQAGVRSVLPLQDTDTLLFVVADQPYLSRATVEALLQAGQASPLACVRSGDRLGNPVLFSARFAPELLALTGDHGGRTVLRRHAALCAFVRCDARELVDFDVPM